MRATATWYGSPGCPQINSLQENRLEGVGDQFLSEDGVSCLIDVPRQLVSLTSCCQILSPLPDWGGMIGLRVHFPFR